MLVKSRVATLLASKNETQKDLAVAVGWSEKYMSEVVNGKKGQSYKNYESIARALDTSVSFLTGETNDSQPTSLPWKDSLQNGSKSILEKHLSSEVGQSPIGDITSIRISNKSVDTSIVLPVGENDDTMHMGSGKGPIGTLASSRTNDEVVSNVATVNKAMMIPVVTKDVSACCGKGSMYGEDVKWEIVGYYPMDPTDLIGYTWQTKEFCIIRVEGDSMEPHIHDGDRVLFAKSPDVEVLSGDFAILLWDGRLLIRGMIFPDERKVILHPTNDDYEDIETTRADERLCVLGKVLGITPAYRKTPGLW